MGLTLVDQFKCGNGLVEAGLSEQRLVHGNQEIAQKICAAAEVQHVKTGSVLIRQGDTGNDMFFILSGSFGIFKNGRERAVRARGCHVGEMALIELGATRSATVIAKEDSIVARITERNFTAIAEQHPVLWRRVAMELSSRLREVTPQIEKRNDIPRAFIGSSTEALAVANALRDKIASKDLIVNVWDQNVFCPSQFALESLEEAAKEYDFAIFVFHPDDVIFSRKKFVSGPRDNVVLETGLFIGALGRRRTYVLSPSDLKIPSDLLGFNLITYVNTSPFCMDDPSSRLLAAINKLGPK